MASIVYKVFSFVFKLVGYLMISGFLVAVLMDLQKLAFESKKRGLVSMLSVNEQLVGKSEFSKTKKTRDR